MGVLVHSGTRKGAIGPRLAAWRMYATYAVISCVVLLLGAALAGSCVASDVPESGASCSTCGTDSIAREGGGVLRDSVTGETRSIPIHREETSIRLGSGERLVEVKYVADIPLFLEGGTNTSTKSRVDSSVSYRLTLTQYYSEITIDGWYYVSVSKYKGTWQRLDTQVAASFGILRASANGYVLGGGQLHWVKDHDSGFVPGSYSTRTFVPDWAGT